MSNSAAAEQVQPALSRAERRRAEREERFLVSAEERRFQSKLKARVTRLELSKVLAPLVASGQQHECVLSFLLEKGLTVRDGRAVLDPEEFNAYLGEKNEQAKQAKDSDRNTYFSS